MFRRSLIAHVVASLGALALPAAAAPPNKKKPAQHPPEAALPVHGGAPGAYLARADVQAWLAEQTADGALLQAQGPDAVRAALAQARYQARVAQLILPPPPGVPKNWAAYRDRFIEPRRLQAGLAFWAAHEDALARAEAQFGVPASLVVGIIGVETFYGRIMGSFRVLDALATLAFDFPGGRSDRSPFFKNELAAFLKLAAAEGEPATQFVGSFAGAMGLGQFMPSSWLAYAIDFDGDGHIDLIGNPRDAIGSVANFLLKHGWQAGLSTHLAVEPPADAAAAERLRAPDILPSWSLAELDAAGLPLPERDRERVAADGPWALVQLENGAAAPSHVLASRNFHVVTRYNRSAYYALAVIQLGERIAQLRQAA